MSANARWQATTMCANQTNPTVARPDCGHGTETTETADAAVDAAKLCRGVTPQRRGDWSIFTAVMLATASTVLSIVTVLAAFGSVGTGTLRVFGYVPELPRIQFLAVPVALGLMVALVEVGVGVCGASITYAGSPWTPSDWPSGLVGSAGVRGRSARGVSARCRGDSWSGEGTRETGRGSAPGLARSTRPRASAGPTRQPHAGGCADEPRERGEHEQCRGEQEHHSAGTDHVEPGQVGRCPDRPEHLDDEPQPRQCSEHTSTETGTGTRDISLTTAGQIARQDTGDKRHAE